MLFQAVDQLLERRGQLLDMQRTLRLAQEFEVSHSDDNKVRISIQGDTVFVNGIQMTSPTSSEFIDAIGAIKFDVDKALEDAIKKVAAIEDILK